MQQQLGDGEPTAYVALDEAFDPYISVAGVLVESGFSLLNDRINSLYQELCGEYYLQDLGSFESFVKHGFHATADTTEISTRFISFLSRSIDFKSYIYLSDGTSRPDLSPKRTVLILYRELVRDILKKYGKSWTVHFNFEYHQELSPFFERLVDSAKKGIRHPPKTIVSSGKKQDPPLLAVADYVLWVTNKWIEDRCSDRAKSAGPESYLARNFLAIGPSVSVVRSLERGTLTRRTLAHTPQG